MRCIKCGADNNYRDRHTRKVESNFLGLFNTQKTDLNFAYPPQCLQCGHPFIFEPKDLNPKITDAFFSKVFNSISFNQSLYYTSKQFNYYLDKILKLRLSKNLLGVKIFVYLFLSIWFPGFFGGILASSFQEKAFIIAYLGYNIVFIMILFSQGYFNTKDSKYRHQIGKMLKGIGGIVIFVGIFIISLVSQASSLWISVSLMIGIFSIFLGNKIIKNKNIVSQTFLLTSDKIIKYLNCWQEINGSIENLLPSPNLENQNIEIDFDISNYSFDKLVVCDSAEMAQFLIANNFHFENNCAILSITRYPEHIFDTVLEMVKNNSNLKVYALHHCTPKGISLVQHLQTSENWFANHNVQIYDLGLFPRQVLKMKNPFVLQADNFKTQAKAILPEIRRNLSTAEIKFLEQGFYVELESFSPKYLLRVVRKGILKTNKSELPPNWSNLDTFESEDDDSKSDNFIFIAENFG